MRADSLPERILLISDLHLEEERPALTRAFEDFLAREAADSSALYILGDLFDLWIGDDDDRPLNEHIAALLKRHSDKGLAVYLLHGNRDFLLGGDFAARAGATLIQEPHVLTHGDHACLLMHGDSLCTGDQDYQNFRSQVRDSQWQRRFLAQSLAQRRDFAARARATSRSMNSNKAEDIMDVTQDEVERQLAGHGLDTLIHGHTHRPAVHEFTVDGTPCRRIVLGDWGESFWFVEITGEGSRLVQSRL